MNTLANNQTLLQETCAFSFAEIPSMVDEED